LLLIVHQASIAEVVIHLGITQFAAKVRAADQLKRLYSTWLQEYYPEVSIGLLGDAQIRRGGAENILSIDGRIESGNEVDDDVCANIISMLERNCLGNVRRASTNGKEQNATGGNVESKG
jgi:hypothetical protein